MFSMLLFLFVYANNQRIRTPSVEQQPSKEIIVLEEMDTVVFKDDVTDESMLELINEINSKLELVKKKTHVVNLVMITDGGSVPAGMDFINYANELPVKIRTITINSSSMGFHIVQGLGERLIVPYGKLLAHQATGYVGVIKMPITEGSNVALRLKRVKVNDDRSAKRMNISYKEFVNRIAEKDYVMYAEQAMKQNAVDRIVEIQCGQSIIDSGKCPK